MVVSHHCPNVSTTPLQQWGFRQCLPFSWTTLRGKHCWHPIAVMGVVYTFGHTDLCSRYLVEGCLASISLDIFTSFKKLLLALADLEWSQ